MHDKEILIKNWLLKSDEALEDAKLNLDNNRLPNAQNRLYYSIFYSVMALAQKQSFTTSKHAQLLGWFNKEFIKTGKVDKKYGKLYTSCFDNRQKSDYTIMFKPGKQNLLEDIEKAQEFIKVIKQLLKENSNE